jgi:hypothetical protein
MRPLTFRRRPPRPPLPRWPDGQQVCGCNRPYCGNSVPGRRRVAEAAAPDSTTAPRPRPGPA